MGKSGKDGSFVAKLEVSINSNFKNEGSFSINAT